MYDFVEKGGDFVDIKVALELLKERLSVRIMERLDASADPGFFKLATALDEALQDVIEEIGD